MSLYPVYKRMVRGSTVDPDDHDFFHRRSLRAHSALPDSWYLRGYDTLPNSLVQRSLSTARDIIEEPVPSLKSLDAIDYCDTANTISRLRDSLQRSGDYWLDRYTDEVIRPTTRVYVSTGGHAYPLYSHRRHFPSTYWSNYPYSSTLPPFFNYGKKYWSLDDPLNDNYLHKDPYTSSKGIYRQTWRDWTADFPHRNYPTYYRPMFTRSPLVRNSYLYPKYI